MYISFDEKNKVFRLETKNTVYGIGILYEKYLEHLYYGKKTEDEFSSGDFHYYAFSPYTSDSSTMSLDNMPSEIPFFGSGDMRCTALRIKSGGSSVTKFIYKNYKIIKGRKKINGLPFAECDDCETLIITLEDSLTGCEADLYYTVFYSYDVISRYVTVRNNGKEKVTVEKLMSLTLDLDGWDWDLITLHGAHCWERLYSRQPVRMGNQSVYSRRGASSHQFNPFIALCRPKTTEEKGEAIGINFVYSGNFLSEVEKSQDERIRVQTGLGSENFSWLLEAGEEFTSPEAVMTYSECGIGGMSRNFHRFTRDCILPKDTLPYRPVVLNSWEAVFFNINEDLLVDFAKEAVKCGIDMLVMDDGWFGKRLSDNAGLGDWRENRDRFPRGLCSFVERVKETGISFGIWIEPEMVNPDSELYRAHPDWVISTPGRERSESRQQLVLDMTNPEVREYLKNIFTETLGDVPIDYIKWDMNRHMSEVGSSFVPDERQGEVPFRYMLGVYELLGFFREKFPNIILETCSGGGGRYDLGMMKYGNMIWTSDQTWPEMRSRIQFGSSLAYPSSTMSCHVSNPWDDEDEMFFRWAVALQGMLGYEFDILKLSDKIKSMIPKQISEYKEYEHLIREGDLYRVIDPDDIGDFSAYYYINADASEILATFLQTGDDAKKKKARFRIGKANPASLYVDKRSGKEYSGRELRRGFEYSAKEKKYAEVFYFVEKK